MMDKNTAEHFNKEYKEFRKFWLNVLNYNSKKEESNSEDNLLYSAIKEMLSRISYLYGLTDGSFSPPALKEIYEIGDNALRSYDAERKNKE